MKNLRRPLPLAGFLFLLVTLVPAGCRAGGPPRERGPTAECPVCAHEGDLACVCVEIEPDTPHCQCGGKTYYFCSDECRADFEKHPERYLSHR